MTGPGARDVPDHPAVVLLEGDGVGPEVLAAARRAMDAACARAYGKKRAIGWRPMPSGSANDGLPAETLDAARTAGLVLRGPFARSEEGAPSRSVELGRALDLFAATVRIPVGARGIVVVLEASEGAAGPAEATPAGVETDALLVRLKGELSAITRALRFGTRERVESYLRSLGRRETALVETGFALELTSLAGVERVAEAAIRLAKREGRHRLSLVVDPETAPRASATFADEAYRVASERFPGEVATWPDFQRARVRAGEREAAALREEALAHRLWLEPRTFASLCEVADDPSSLDVVLAPWSPGLLLAHLLAGKHGGVRAAAMLRENPGTGAAVGETLHGTANALRGKGKADATAAVRAGAQLLSSIGWSEAAALVKA